MSSGGINKIILVGRLGRDAEVKQVSSGCLCVFSLAVSEAWTDKSGEKKERTQWFNVNLWGKLAEILCPYLKKGRQVYVEGNMLSKDSEKDGIKKTYWAVNAKTVQLVGDAPRGEQETAKNEQYAEDDNPFSPH